MQHLDYLKQDTALYSIIQHFGAIKPQIEKDSFLHLIRTVAGQQLSTKAAASIFEKFLRLMAKPTPQKVLALDVEELRSVGYSYNKSAYIKNIAQFWIDHNISSKTFEKMADEEIILWLTQIKGVGRWSVEILLAFSLGRKNIFFADDLGIQQGMCLLYGWDSKDKKALKKKMLAKAETYAPFTTIVCLYIWKWKNKIKTEMAAENRKNKANN
ncbi:DNA-3-methyladenine glycosylase family protein [Chitinophagaceae bacterium MMS25-I14]